MNTRVMSGLMPQKFCRDYEVLYRESLTARGFFGKVLLRGSVLMMFFGRLGEQSGLVGRFARLIYLLMSRRRGIEFNYSAIRGGGYNLHPCVWHNRQ